MLTVHLKILAITFLLLFLSSCNDNSPKEVTAGVAAQTNVFTKTCSAGSLKITKETTSSSVVPEVLNLQDLPLGDEVTISGTVNNGAVCGFSGPVSFSCKATVGIDLNKAFSCVREQIISGLNNSYNSLGTTNYVNPVTTPPIHSGPVNPAYNTYHQRTLITGDFIIYYGATKTFTSLTVNSSSPLVPAPCTLSFICE